MNTVDRLLHLKDLLRKYQIAVTWEQDGSKWVADTKNRHIRVGYPYTPEAYLSALHEIAHCVDPLAFGHPRYYLLNTLRCEARAWEWAYAHSLETPCPGQSKKVQYGLSSYLRSRRAPSAEQKMMLDKYLGFQWPPYPGPREIFWTLLRYGNIYRIDHLTENVVDLGENPADNGIYLK